MTGKVRHWDVRRRFGKLTGEDRREYFAHVDDLLDVLGLTPGQRVTFTPAESPRGSRAVDVQVIEGMGTWPRRSLARGPATR